MAAKTVTVRVLKKSIRRVGVGETLEVSERDARVLEKLKRVERVNPVVVEEPSAPRKRVYRRRDMKAEE